VTHRGFAASDRPGESTSSFQSAAIGWPGHMARAPEVGQAVLAFARSYPNSGPNSVRAGRGHRLPHLRSSRHRKEWLSPFSPPGRNCGARSGGLNRGQASTACPTSGVSFRRAVDCSDVESF
jgi:hypothetical protein